MQGNDSFSIEYVNRDPQKAARVTNMLAEQFIEDTRYLRDSLTQQTREFIESNLDEARQTLETRETALRRIKQQHWGALPEQLDTNLKMLAQLQFEQQTLGENLRTMEARRAASRAPSSSAARRACPPAPTMSSGDPRAQLAKLQGQYAALRDRYTEEHPDMKAVQMRIARLEQQIARPDKPRSPGAGREHFGVERHPRPIPRSPPWRSRCSGSRLEIDAVKARRDKLDRRIADLQKRVEQTPRVEQDLMSLTRDYQQLKESYTGLVRKDMDARMARNDGGALAGEVLPHPGPRPGPGASGSSLRLHVRGRRPGRWPCSPASSPPSSPTSSTTP